MENINSAHYSMTYLKIRNKVARQQKHKSSGYQPQ
jgi:hypothetical protein